MPEAREEKPCPGLNGIYCGEPRAGKTTYAAYCKLHVREYQRNRYVSLRQKLGQNYVERIVVRTQQDACDCCGCPATGQLTEMPTTGGKLVCDQCWQFSQNVINEYGYGRFRKIVEFATEFPLSFLPKRDKDDKAITNSANPGAPKPGHSTEILDRKHYGKQVSTEEAFEYEYVRRIWDTAKRYGFDPDGDDTYEYVETNFGADIKTRLEREIADGSHTLRTELTEEEAPWLF